MGELARHIVAVTDNEGSFRRSLPPLLLRPVSRRLRPGRIQVLQFLKECEEEVTDSAHRAEQYKIYQDRLGLEVTPFENCDDLKMLFSSKAKLWRGVDNWTKQSAQWRETQFIAVDVDAMNKDIQ